jgi:hypothetical protein
MARWPAPGRCKSRLAAGIGPWRAAAIQRRLSRHVLRTATVVAEELEVVLAVTGLGPSAARRWGRCLGADRTVPQGGGSLGLRLQRQVIRALREGSPAVLLIGTDLPQVTATDLRQACLLLNRSPLVLGPATDGGYWLIGLQRSSPLLFSGIAWGSDQVLKQTLEQARRAGLDSRFLAQAADLDRPADLLAWR